MANKANKEKARAWRMEYRRKVRRTSAAYHVAAAVSYARCAVRTAPLTRRSALVASAVFQVAMSATKMALSVGEQSALSEFEDGYDG